MRSEPVRVRWTVAEDPGLRQVVRRGAVAATPEAGHATRGYARVDVTADRSQVTFRGLADATAPDSPASDLARFVVESGQPRPQSA